MGKIKSIIFALLITTFWFVSVLFAFVVPEIQWKYQNPNICVHLSEPLIAINGFSDVDNDPGLLKWSSIEDVIVVGRREGTVEISNDYQAYIDFENTTLRDTLNDNQRNLSKEELYSLFAKISKGEDCDIEFEDIPLSKFGMISPESKIVVKGRYVGSIALTTSRVYSEEKTNVAQVWTIIDNLPWLQIIESFLTTVVVFVLVLAILLKTKNNKKVILLIVGAIILLIAVAFIYSNRMI